MTNKCWYIDWYDGAVTFIAFEDDGYPRLYRWHDEETVGDDIRVYYADQAFWEINAGIPPKRMLETDVDEWKPLV